MQISKGNEMEDEKEEEERKRRSEEFKRKRAQHYNEFKSMQKNK